MTKAPIVRGNWQWRGNWKQIWQDYTISTGLDPNLKDWRHKREPPTHV